MQSEKPEPVAGDADAQSTSDAEGAQTAQAQGSDAPGEPRSTERPTGLHDNTPATNGSLSNADSAAPESIFKRPETGDSADAASPATPLAESSTPGTGSPADDADSPSASSPGSSPGEAPPPATHPSPVDPDPPVTPAHPASPVVPGYGAQPGMRPAPGYRDSSPTGSPLSPPATRRETEVPAPPTEPVTPGRPTRVEKPHIVSGPAKPRGLLDLGPGEDLLREVDSGDDGKFVLTSMRLIYQGRSAEGALFAAAAVEDVTSIEFGRRARDSRSAWWGVIGMIAAIAVWQVTTNEDVGAIAGAVVAGISALLLADYWFRPPGLILRFGTPGGAVEGAVSGKRMRDAEELAAEVQQLRHSSGRGSRKPSGGPPGGSPGL